MDDQKPTSQHDLRGIREKAFEVFMDRWQEMDDRQRRTWLAWLVGRLDAESLEGLRIRLSERRRRQ